MPPKADKIVLLPRCDAPPHLDSRTVARSLSAFEQKLEPKIAVPIPFGVGESGWVGTLVSPRPPSLNESLAISQKKFLYEVLKVFGNKFRALKISDEPGIGKKTFAAELAHFATVRPPGEGAAEALALDELAGNRRSCAGNRRTTCSSLTAGRHRLYGWSPRLSGCPPCTARRCPGRPCVPAVRRRSPTGRRRITCSSLAAEQHRLCCSGCNLSGDNQNTHLSRWYARSSIIVKDEMIQNPTGMRFVDGNLFG